MVYNRSRDNNCKTTLIVAPVALLSQWTLEIEMKTACGFECVIYHGRSLPARLVYRSDMLAGNTKPRSKKEILSYDFVLTTYGTLANGRSNHPSSSALSLTCFQNGPTGRTR